MPGNPFQRHLASASRRQTVSPSTTDLRPHLADRDVLQAVVTRRLAMRFGITAPLAATVAALAGLGPNEEGR
ncbi:hypothetical protein [uncultured Enterovirga sp.]|uniref:hypothetical protein n=1 Tax=uncultured Enterovirga sp. TaxID=2026352 RepID=UPI0035CCA21D